LSCGVPSKANADVGDIDTAWRHRQHCRRALALVAAILSHVKESMKSVRLVQVYYREDQRPELDELAVPYFNRDLDPLYENRIILDLLRARDYRGHDYWGVTSWRLRQKTDLSVEAISTAINTGSTSSVYIYDNEARGEEVALNRDNAIGAILKRLRDLHGLFPDERWVPVLRNFWLADNASCGRYFDFLSAMHLSLTEDTICRRLLTTAWLDHRGSKTSLHPFVYEYLFGLFLRNNPDIEVRHIIRLQLPGRPTRWMVASRAKAASSAAD
jgi:hypothetical protein